MAAGFTALEAPSVLMMTPSVAKASAFTFFALAIVRFRAGYRVLRYQWNLRRLPRYELSAHRLPVSRKRLFIGRGFLWTQKHTQRLRDTLRPEVQRYLEPSWLYRCARALEIRCDNVHWLQPVARVLASSSRLNPVAPLPPVGGRPTLHAVGAAEQSVFVPIGERVGHMLVLGTTRVGKTRLAEVLITQDIHRGDVVIVLDPKGDPDLLRRCYSEAKRAGRLNAFYALHLGFPEWSARYNAIGSFERETEIATRVARQLPSSGNSAAFREFSWRFVNIVARALIAMDRRPDFKQLLQHVTHIEPLFIEYCEHWLPGRREGWTAEVEELEGDIKERNLETAFRGREKRTIALLKYLERHRLYDPVLDGLRSAVRYDKTYFDKIVASLLPLLEKLTTGKVAELIAPDYANRNDPRPIFDWLSVIRQQGIVYVGLDALGDQEVAAAVGNSMFADLVSVCGRLYKHGIEDSLPGVRPTYRLPTISLHADEFNELIGDEFVPLINKGGGAGMQVTAYTQTWSDIEARVESRTKAGQVIGNFNTLVMFRVKELATAELLTEQLPLVETHELMLVSSSQDSSDPDSGVDFTSHNEDRINVSRGPLIAPSDIVTLPKGQAFVLMEGQLWKIRVPLPARERDPTLPEDLRAMADAMREVYAASEHGWSRRDE